MKIQIIDGEVTEVSQQDWQAFEAWRKEQAKDWPQGGDTYWFIGESHVTSYKFDSDYDDTDAWLLSIGNVYRTEAEALAQVEKLKAKARIDKYIADNGLEVAQPTELVKWAVCCDASYSPARWESCAFGSYVYGGLCLMFQCRDHAQQVIDNCTDNLNTIFGVK